MRNKIIVLTLFSIAMGYLETAVVTYLRIIYFPHDNNHPLFTPTTLVLITELGRELATIIMLWGAACLTAESRPQRFAFFLYSFAIWDLFYYVFLKLLLNWPETIFDWDLLFLLPVPWIGPVLAPCIASCFMIILSLVTLNAEKKTQGFSFSKEFWFLLVSGNLLIILSFINYSVPLVIQYLRGDAPNYVIQNIKQFIPNGYNWTLFAFGQALIVVSIIKLKAQKNRVAISLYHTLRPVLLKIIPGKKKQHYPPDQK